jgi:hypothetical protein
MAALQDSDGFNATRGRGTGFPFGRATLERICADLRSRRCDLVRSVCLLWRAPDRQIEDLVDDLGHTTA